MKLGFQVALYLLCLNLTCGLIYGLNVAGTSYSMSLQGTGDPSDYSDRFESDEMMNQTDVDIWTIAPYLAAIYGGLMVFWNAVTFIFAGFPAMLWQFGGMIQDPTARAAYLSIIAVLGAVEAFVIFGWIFQILSGRVVQD